MAVISLIAPSAAEAVEQPEATTAEYSAEPAMVETGADGAQGKVEQMNVEEQEGEAMRLRGGRCCETPTFRTASSPSSRSHQFLPQPVLNSPAMLFWGMVEYDTNLAVFASGFVLELTCLVSPFALIFATWLIVYYERWKAYCCAGRRRTGSLRRYYDLQQLFAQYLKSERPLLYQYLATHLIAQVDDLDPFLRPVTFLRLSGFTLAGVLVTYLLPLPSLRHLKRKPSLRDFLPLLLTAPGWYLYLRFLIGLDDHRLKPDDRRILLASMHALADLARMTLPSGSLPLDEEEARRALVPHLEAAAPDSSFPALERRAQGAILDAIYERKGRKEEEIELQRKQQRSKQE
ncbi:hypothetical protein JCM8547_007766 [Rhodosporidiobolus lusitaniae]